MNTLSVVHDVLRRQVREGDFCIDATAGKGRDTALLCRLTGENGRVLAFDVQEDAVRQTREQLRLALAHGKVDIARRPVRRAHIGENGHGLVAHGVAALAHEHDHHLAEFRAG